MSRSIAVRPFDEHARKIAGIVFDPKSTIEPSRPWAQHVIPVAKPKEAHAVTPDAAFLKRQEIIEKLGIVMRKAERLPTHGDGVAPGRNRRQQERPMPRGIETRARCRRESRRAGPLSIALVTGSFRYLSISA